jgi:hypothetical protein
MEQKIIAYNQSEIEQIKENSILPIKIRDEEGKIKKVLLEKSFNFIQPSGVAIIYLNFPLITSPAPEIYASLVMNFSILKKFPLHVQRGISYFKAEIYNDNLGALKAEIDVSLNHGKFNINDKKIVYYTEGESNHYYLKLQIQNTGSSNDYFDIKYPDISSNVAIPEDFSYDNMILHQLPGTEQIYENCEIFMRHACLDAARLSGVGPGAVVITTSGSSNPGSTLPNIYPDTASKWLSPPTQIGETGYYIWKYTDY